MILPVLQIDTFWQIHSVAIILFANSIAVS
jgi:hypothetical protein